MSTLLQDGRHALRLLASRPGFAFTIFLTFALGIGATSVMFSIVNTVLLRPLPYAEPDMLVRIQVLQPGADGIVRTVSAIQNYDFAQLRSQSVSLANVAAYRRGVAVNFMDGTARTYTGVRITTDTFAMLGVRPLLGRDFVREEHTSGVPGAIILGFDLWRDRFDGDSSVVGQTLRLSGFVDGPDTVPSEADVTVVGVMPEGFSFPPQEPATFWLPYEVDAGASGRVLPQAVARLRSGVTPEQAEVDLNRIADRLAEFYPDWNPGRRFSLRSFQDDVTRQDQAETLWIFSGAVGFVFLIAVANASNLLLVNGLRRVREMEIRRALGASSGRLMRQLLTESLVLSLLAGVPGLGLALVATDLTGSRLSPVLVHVDEVSVSGRVLGFTFAASVLAGLLSGLVPGFRRGPRAVAGTRRTDPFVVCQISLALVLLIGSGLLLRSFQNLNEVDLGFDPSSVLMTTVNGVQLRTPDTTAQRAFYRSVLERVLDVPGVDSAAVVFPGIGEEMSYPTVLRTTPGGEIAAVGYRSISPDYFRVLGISLRSGRTFEESDSADSEPVAIVNETMAERLWPGEPAAGQFLYARTKTYRVVGIVADVRDTGRVSGILPTLYVPYLQDGRAFRLLVRAETDVSSIAVPVQEAVRRVDVEVPIPAVFTLGDVLSDVISLPRFRSVLLGSFAAVALLMASVGIYSVLASAVAQRTREIGIRVAVGATRRTIFNLILARGAVLTLAGVGMGLIGAFGLTRYLESMLFGLAPLDPVTFLAMSIVLVGAVFLACYVPVRRAVNIDPVVALRQD